MFVSPNLSAAAASSGDQEQIYHSQRSLDSTAISWSALEATPSPSIIQYDASDSASIPSVSLSSVADFASSDDEWSNARHSSSPMSIHSPPVSLGGFDHFPPSHNSPLLATGVFSYGSASPASHVSSGSATLPYVSGASSPFLSEQQTTWLAPDGQYESEDIVSQGIQEIRQGIPPPYSQQHVSSPTAMSPPAYDCSTIFSLHTNHYHSPGSQDDFSRGMENLTIDNITNIEFGDVFEFDDNFKDQTNNVNHALKAPISPQITIALPADASSLSHEFDDNLDFVGNISTRRRRSQSDLSLVSQPSTSAIPSIGSHQRQFCHGPSNSVDSGFAAAAAAANNGGTASALGNFLHPNDAKNLRRGRSLNAMTGDSSYGVGAIRSPHGWPIPISGYHHHRRGSVSRSSSPYTRPSSVASTHSNVPSLSSSYRTTGSSSPSSSPRSISSLAVPHSPPSSSLLASVTATVTSMPKQENMVEVPESERRYKPIVAHPRVNDANHRRRTTEAKFKCEICGDDFTRKFRLQTHMNSHLNQHRYHCRSEGCTSMFNNLDDCVRHESQQHNAYRIRRESGCV